MLHRYCFFSLMPQSTVTGPQVIHHYQRCEIPAFILRRELVVLRTSLLITRRLSCAYIRSQPVRFYPLPAWPTLPYPTPSTLPV